MALLRIRDKQNGEIVEIASLPGAKGEDGRDGSDGYTPVKGVDYFTTTEQEAFLASAKDYVDEKTKAATTETYGTVKVVDDEDTAYFSGVMHSAGGYLRVVAATEQEIDDRYGQCKPIVPANLEYAVKSVGDGYYAKAQDVAKEKVYEHIATITVEADEDGSLPQHVIFSADSEGNPFELTDFYVHCRAGMTDGGASTLYMGVNGSGNAVIGNAAVAFTASALRSSTVFFRHENDGFLSVCATSSMAANGAWNSQGHVTKQILIPPADAAGFLPVTAVDLYTLLGTNKTWVAGSKFELYGVRR